MRSVFIDELIKLAEIDADVVLITGDLGFGLFEDFAERFPEQFLNAGVAEQNMTMVAAGMAMEGKKVFTYSIGNFPTLRCLEQIRNDICYHDLNVTITSIGGGFSYGQLGMSHHATEDLSIMRALPNMTVVAPGTFNEVRGAMQALYKISTPAYLRLDKSQADISKDQPGFKLGKACMIRDGDAATLIATGGILEEALQAADVLAQNDIYCRVLSMHTIKPLDLEAIDLAIVETGAIITVEENTTIGGLGSAIAEHCLESLTRPNFFKRVGLENTYSSIVGDQKYLRDYYQMNAQNIVRIVKELVC